MAEQIVAASGLKATHVPYPGAAALKPDLLTGRIDFTIDAMPLILPFIRDERVAAIGITVKDRDPKLPTTPTFAELGLLSGDYTGWTGLFAPKATPDDVVVRIRELALGSLKDDVVAKITAADYRPGNPKQSSFADFVKSEETRWGDIVKKAGITPV
jgi:tripartite-type tricarboxylate transporter receptor subunit TctC